MGSMRREIFFGLGLISVLLLVLAALLYKRVAGVSPFARDSVVVRNPLKPIKRKEVQAAVVEPTSDPSSNEQVAWNSDELGEFGEQPKRPDNPPQSFTAQTDESMTTDSSTDPTNTEVSADQFASPETDSNLDLFQPPLDSTTSDPPSESESTGALAPSEQTTNSPPSSRNPLRGQQQNNQQPSESNQPASYNDGVYDDQPPSEYDTSADQSGMRQMESGMSNGAPVGLENGKYTVQPNDTFWTIAEKIYGNGGYFRAVHEHNRARFPRSEKLQVGDVIEVPPVEVLEQRYAALCPRARKVPSARQTLTPASARRTVGDRVYVVSEGDSLFDIARYELGKASRWTEIYDMNRDVLGEDFDYLRPGTELVLPQTRRETDAITRKPRPGYQR